MTDGFACIVIFIGLIALAIFMFRHFGSYEEQLPLGPGEYVVGYDIPPGKCDIIAATGGGSFIVRNRVAKAWEVGNTIGITSGLQPGRFRNLRLGRGDVLEINGKVTVLLTPPRPIRDPVAEPLGPGTYRFGLDVPPGRYDLEVVSGDGDVLLVEIKKDQYVFYQDLALENPFKPDSFKNIVCTPEFELWVNGNLNFKLKPSEKQPLLLRLLKIRTE